MKVYSLVIGNNKYTSAKNLTNAVNDASDIASKLKSLGFTVDLGVDTDIVTFDKHLASFSKNLVNFECGIFYYGGHGLQFGGSNYLTAVDTGFVDEYSVKRSSIPLDEIIDRMYKAKTKINILILDACRDNPFTSRGIDSGLAPVHAPKGTFIAFSTSPGEKASDVGAGRNSVYTGALLRHIDDLHITIEDLFKRVRTTVHSQTSGNQTSWEHTSLIGDFIFNKGQITHSVNVQYNKNSVADVNFISTGSDIDNIIEDFRSHNWYVQRPALHRLEGLTYSKANIDENKLFLVGRNLLQSAKGGEGDANEIFNDLNKWFETYVPKGFSHILNGILFEIYFNSEGKFRAGNFKVYRQSDIFKLQEIRKYEESFNFISQALEPFKHLVLYLPSITPKSVPLEVTIDEIEVESVLDSKQTKLVISLIEHQGVNMLQAPFDYDFHRSSKFSDFKNLVSIQLAIPIAFIQISTNITITDDTLVSYPWDINLQKK